MDQTEGKFTKKQKLLALGGVVILLIVLIVAVILGNQNKSNPPVEPTPQAVVVPPAPVELPNDLTGEGGVIVDFAKYPNPNFPALKLSDVYGGSKVSNPPVQYDGQPRTFIDCGRLISDDPAFKNIIKKACVNRKVEDGSVVSLGANEKDYIFYLGKSRGTETITLVKDLSEGFSKIYLIYEYSYNTQSSNYIDKITLNNPEAILGDDYDYNTCPYDKLETYSLPQCQSEHDFGTVGNPYYLKSKDKYFRDVNLP